MKLSHLIRLRHPVGGLPYYHPDGARFYSQEFVDTLVRARDSARKEAKGWEISCHLLEGSADFELVQAKKKIEDLTRERDFEVSRRREMGETNARLNTRLNQAESENLRLRAALKAESSKTCEVIEDLKHVKQDLANAERALVAERSKGPVYVVAWDPALEPGDALVCPPAEQTKLLEERRHMLDNLTATQQRCTELLEEVRRLKGQAPPAWCPDVNMRVIATYAGCDYPAVVLRIARGVAGTPNCVWLVQIYGRNYHVFERHLRLAE